MALTSTRFNFLFAGFAKKHSQLQLKKSNAEAPSRAVSGDESALGREKTFERTVQGMNVPVGRVTHLLDFSRPKHLPTAL